MSDLRSYYRDLERAERQVDIQKDETLCLCGSHMSRHRKRCEGYARLAWMRAGTLADACSQCRARGSVHCFDARRKPKPVKAKIHSPGIFASLRSWIRIIF